MPSCANKELLQVLEHTLLKPAFLPVRAVALHICGCQVFEDSALQSGVEVLFKLVCQGS
jgi:hypothetical protein